MMFAQTKYPSFRPA